MPHHSSETESSEDETKEEVQSWPPPRKRKNSTGDSNVKEILGVDPKASLGKVLQNGSTSVKPGPNHSPPKAQGTTPRNPPPPPAIRSGEVKAQLKDVTPAQRREVQGSHTSEPRSDKENQVTSRDVASTTPREPPPTQGNGHVGVVPPLARMHQPPGLLAEILKRHQLNGAVAAQEDEPPAPVVRQEGVIAAPRLNGQEHRQTDPHDKRPETSVNSEADIQEALSKNNLRVERPRKSVDPRPFIVPESRKISSEPTMPRESWTPDDPFMSCSVGGKLEGRVDTLKLFDRRHTLDGRLDGDVRVDLREVAKQLWSRPSLPTARHARTLSTTSLSRFTPESSHTTTSVSARTANLNRSLARRSSLLPIPVADEDQEKIDFLGMSMAIKMMATNFGFREESVWRMWKFFRNIGMTEEFCRRYWAKMGRMEDDVLEEMEREGVDLDGLFKENEVAGMFVGVSDVMKEGEDEGHEFRRRNLRMDGLSLGEEEKRKEKPSKVDLENELQRSERRVSRSPMKEAQLRVRPWVEDDDDTMSDYVPPHSSRAGQYARLVKQGRKEEALAREERRASGGRRRFMPKVADNSPTKQVHNVTPPLRNSGSVVLSSRAVVRRKDEDGDDTHDDVDEEEEAEVQEEVEVSEEVVGEDEDATEPPSEPEQVDDLFGDDNPLTEEEEMALLSASRANADVLHEIEQRVGADAMFLWTAAHLGEFRDSYLMSNIAQKVVS